MKAKKVNVELIMKRLKGRMYKIEQRVTKGQLFLIQTYIQMFYCTKVKLMNKLKQRKLILS